MFVFLWQRSRKEFRLSLQRSSGSTHLLLFRFCLSLTRSPPCPQQINCRLWRHCTYWAGAAASTTSVAVPQPSCCCCAVVRLLSYCCILLCCLLLYVLCTRVLLGLCVHSSTAALGVSRVSWNLLLRSIIICSPGDTSSKRLHIPPSKREKNISEP